MGRNGRRQCSKKLLCKVCEGNHPLQQCLQFQAASIEERLRIILLNHFCSNCLGLHKSEDCQSQFRCRRCGERHHVLLHEEAAENKKDAPYLSEDEGGSVISLHPLFNMDEGESLATDSTRALEREAERVEPWPSNGGATRLAPNHSISADRVRARNFSPHVLEGTAKNFRRNCFKRCHSPLGIERDLRQRLSTEVRSATQAVVALAPTIVVWMHIGGIQRKIRAMINPCIPLSVIDSQAVRDLNFRYERQGDERVCIGRLRGVDGTEEIPIVARVRKDVRMRMPKRSLSSDMRSQFSEFKLADPDFYISANVDMVLGADVYTKVMRGGSMHLIGNLMLQKTKFGGVVVGSELL